MTSRSRYCAFTRLLPGLVLIAMLGATALLWNHERQSADKALRAQFDFALRDTVSRIEQHELSYEQMLRGLEGLLATTALADGEAIRNYVEALNLDANFSGLQSIGVLKWLPSAEKDRFVAAMRAGRFPDYAITPAGERDCYAPVISNAASLGRKNAPPGFDPWSEPVRRAAMEKARDSGMPAISAKLRLVIDQGAGLPGFIMYLPVYAHGKPTDSMAQRRENLIGWVYATFHMDDFMASLYGSKPPGLQLAVFDGIDTSDATLMYRTGNEAPSGKPSAAQRANAPAIGANEYMVVAGHTWTLSMRTQDGFERRLGPNVAIVIAVAGTCLSVSIALLVWFVVNGRARALRLADEMTVELRHMAQHDHLTGLPNRALFSDRVHQMLAHAKRHGGYVAMIFIDLDKFKPINDNYGHAVGDLLLQHVALRLRDVVRESDTVGRVGGDEFVILIGDLRETETALKLADSIRHLIAHPFILKGHELTVSCSIGVAFYPDDGADEESLIKNADDAMYRAKDSGRNNVCRAASAASTAAPPLSPDTPPEGA